MGRLRVLFAWLSVALITFYGLMGGALIFVGFFTPPNETLIFPIFGEMQLWVWETVAITTLIMSVVFYRLGRQKILTYYIIALIFSTMLSVMSQMPGLLIN